MGNPDHPYNGAPDDIDAEGAMEASAHETPKVADVERVEREPALDSLLLRDPHFADHVTAGELHPMDADQWTAVGAWIDSINAMLSRHEVLGRKLLTEHRTLQQSAAECLFSAIRQIAEAHRNGWYDARNERSGEIACAINEAMVEEYGTEWHRTPFI